jgi:hypothetical protein
VRANSPVILKRVSCCPDAERATLKQSTRQHGLRNIPVSTPSPVYHLRTHISIRAPYLDRFVPTDKLSHSAVFPVNSQRPACCKPYPNLTQQVKFHLHSILCFLGAPRSKPVLIEFRTKYITGEIRLFLAAPRTSQHRWIPGLFSRSRRYTREPDGLQTPGP